MRQGGVLAPPGADDRVAQRPIADMPVPGLRDPSVDVGVLEIVEDDGRRIRDLRVGHGRNARVGESPGEVGVDRSEHGRVLRSIEQARLLPRPAGPGVPGAEEPEPAVDIRRLQFQADPVHPRSNGLGVERAVPEPDAELRAPDLGVGVAAAVDTLHPAAEPIGVDLHVLPRVPEIRRRVAMVVPDVRRHRDPIPRLVGVQRLVPPNDVGVEIAFHRVARESGDSETRGRIPLRDELVVRPEHGRVLNRRHGVLAPVVRLVADHPDLAGMIVHPGAEGVGVVDGLRVLVIPVKPMRGADRNPVLAGADHVGVVRGLQRVPDVGRRSRGHSQVDHDAVRRPVGPGNSVRVRLPRAERGG